MPFFIRRRPKQPRQQGIQAPTTAVQLPPKTTMGNPTTEPKGKQVTGPRNTNRTNTIREDSILSASMTTDYTRPLGPGGGERRSLVELREVSSHQPIGTPSRILRSQGIYQTKERFPRATPQMDSRSSCKQ